MASPPHRLEDQFDSSTLPGLIRSGRVLLRARRLGRRDARDMQGRAADALNSLLYTGLISVPAALLNTYQTVRHAATGAPKGHERGSWQWALAFSLREDPAHHTVETIGYHERRPVDAREVDDLAAWVMTLTQFLWEYEELMGIVWDEWTMVRLVSEASLEAGLSRDKRFYRLTRQWEKARPYHAPFNGTYGDVRRATFDEFIQPRLEALPADIRQRVLARYEALRSTERQQYQQQMSLFKRIVPGDYRDDKEEIALWDLSIGLIINGRYYLIPVVAHNSEGYPIIFNAETHQRPLHVVDGVPFTAEGEELRLQGEHLYRVQDGQWIGSLEISSFAAIKWQVSEILANSHVYYTDDYDVVDVLLAETPRSKQAYLRGLLSPRTRSELARLTRAPIVLNWDEHERADHSLAQLRRTQRGVGDHALTVIRTDSSFIFDQHHIFFDGVWAMAMAEVLTNAAIAWCDHGLWIAARPAYVCQPLDLHTSARFLEEARPLQSLPEISAETTIHDISNIFGLRRRIANEGAYLTVNDLLVMARIVHSLSYKPSKRVRDAIQEFEHTVRNRADRLALESLYRSIERGREVAPCLGIPVDASPTDPAQRIYLLTFRNTLESFLPAWGDAWNAYQAYRKIEPPNTPEGYEAFEYFEDQRVKLITNLREFSDLLDAAKLVATRGDSFSAAVFDLLAHLPPNLQNLLRQIPEQFNALNEIVRGEEVYSNIGRVAPRSTLSRFITAKDDGRAKHIVWGIMTTDQDKMVVTMRDFRPHVAPLVSVGRIDLAHMLAEDYVNSYTNELLGLVARMTAMLLVTAPDQVEQPVPVLGR